MNDYNNTNERIILTVREIKSELKTLDFLLKHAEERRDELKAIDLPRIEANHDKRRLRGAFVSRLNSEIADYVYRVEMLESMLAGMEE